MEGSKRKISRSEKEFLDLLPRDILEFLCDHLSIKDQLRFARVCKLSHSLVYNRPNPKADDAPWLIGLIEEYSSHRKTICDNKVTCYQIGKNSFKRFSGPHIVQYFKGWLLVQSYCNDLIQLMNLFVNIHVDLPPLSTILHCHRPYARAFALSLCKSMRPVMIAAVSNNGDLALCRINGASSSNSTWKLHEDHQERRPYYVIVTFYHEKYLYAMRDEFQKIDIFEVDNDDLRLFPMSIIDSSRVINRSTLSKLLLRKANLVEDSKGDNMFLVMQYDYHEFEIFKLEHDRFVKVDTLGDQILLLGEYSCSEIIDVKDCPTSPIFKGDQICFISFFRNVGIYSLKDESIIWAMPSIHMHCLQWIFPRFTTTECNCKSH